MKKLYFGPDLYLELATPEIAQLLFDTVDRNREFLGKWLNWVPKTFSPQDTKDFLEKNVSRFNEDKSGAFAIYYKGQFTGLVDLHKIDTNNNKSSIGYWLDKDFHGKGIMTKSVQVLLKYAFEELDINRIAIEAAVENTKSQAVAERLGLEFEGIARAGNWMGGETYYDMKIYSLLRREWEKVEFNLKDFVINN